MINKIQYGKVMKSFTDNYRIAGKGFVATSLLLGTAIAYSNEVTNFRFDTAANMLAYTELELSGEPLAESLGLDLDVLDPDERNQPTEFDYIAGIESYEFSEEAMYELNYRSGLGPNLVHGLRNSLRGGGEASLRKQYSTLALAVSYPESDIAKNLNLISIPYRAGIPEFAAEVDVKTVSTETIEVYAKNGQLIEKETLIPAYSQDYQSLTWVKDSENEIFEPAAIGALLLKEVMWSQDFMGGMHTSVGDEEVEATSSKMDHDSKYSLGVSALDGMNGLILTELSLEKMQYLQQVLGYNGQSLEHAISPNYDPTKMAIWFPHEIRVATKLTSQDKRETKKITQLDVVDSSSQLRDQWLLLWPLSEYYAFSDQRTANTNQNPAFSAVFDGQPFVKAPLKNIDGDFSNDVSANDAFSMASNLSHAVFKNLQALHFNSELGTLVDSYSAIQNNGTKNKSANNTFSQGHDVTTYDAAYALVALSIFQRAQDALPVGYASASQNVSELKTSQGKAALEMINQQANFIIDNLRQKNGLIADSAEINVDNSVAKKVKASDNASLDTQFAVMRGLTAAFLATGQEHFRIAARDLYTNIEKHYYDANLGTWKTPSYSPWSVAAISSAMREAILHLKNNESETLASLELSQLIKRYTRWFRVVVTGIDGKPGLQLAEPLADTGEHRIAGQKDVSSDGDNDGIKQIQAAGGKYGRASVLANELIVN